MEIFNLTLNQMLLMFTLIIVGFLLRKFRVLPENAETTMSRMETYIFCPALNFFNQMKNCTVKTFTENSVLILYGLGTMAVAILLAYPLSKLFIRDPQEAYRRNIYKYAMTFGNFGFMGNFIILGVWGSEFLFKYSMFTFFVSVICSSWGLYVLIPKEKNAKSIFTNLKKGLLAPQMIALFLGMIAGLLNFRPFLPAFLYGALENAGNCMGPVAMVLAGFVIGGYELKSLFTDKKVYMATFLRLFVLPALFVTLLRFTGASKEVLTLALICFATPLGLNTIVYPAAYGGETKTGASMAVISHTLSVISIPAMYYLFIL